MDGWMDTNKKKLKRRTKKWTENVIILMYELLESSICLFFLEYTEDVHVLIIFNVCFFSCKIAILSGNKHVLRGK